MKKLVSRIKAELVLLSRAKRYAHKLNQIDRLLDHYERTYRNNLNALTVQLIQDIDKILG